VKVIFRYPVLGIDPSPRLKHDNRFKRGKVFVDMPGMKLRGLGAISALVLVALTYGCIDQMAEVRGDRRQETVEYAGPIADNILDGYNENNFTKYSRDFSAEMLESLTAANFKSQREEIYGKLGFFISREAPRVYEQGRFIWVEYYAEFEREPGVKVRVVFGVNDPIHRVEGLWFDSPKLRK